MASVDMDSIQFYSSPAKAGLRLDRRPTTSDLRVTSFLREGESPAAPGTSRDSDTVLQDSELVQPQDVRNLL